MVSTNAWSDSVERPCFWAAGGKLRGVLLVLEPLVTGADGGLVKALAGFQAADVLRDLLPLIHKLGIGGDQANKLLAAHRRLAGRLGLEVGDQLHDVVVVDHRAGEEDELEIELIDVGAHLLPRLFPLFPEPLGGFEILAAEGGQVVRGEDGLDYLFLLGSEVGVLVELGLEALHFLEVLDEGGAGRRPP